MVDTLKRVRKVKSSTKSTDLKPSSKAQLKDVSDPNRDRSMVWKHTQTAHHKLLTVAQVPTPGRGTLLILLIAGGAAIFVTAGGAGFGIGWGARATRDTGKTVVR